MNNNDFLGNQLKIREEIKEGNSRWEDLNNYRVAHGKNSLQSDSLRRTTVLLDEYFEAGWIKEPDIEETPNYKETIEYSDSGLINSDRLIWLKTDECKSAEAMLRGHGFDPKEFLLVSAKNSVWNCHTKLQGTKTLYASKITVKPKKSVEDLTLEDVKECFEDMSKNYKVKHEPIKYIKTNGKLLEINLADTHLGKLCWVGETRESYDYKIATERFKYIIHDILSQVEHLSFEEIIFVWSNDFFHFDTVETTTTAGTKQDSDLRWQKLFRVGVELLVWAIDLLSQKSPVRTFYLGSNHDKMTAYYCVNYLHAWYKDNENVTVDYDAIARKYIEYGKCLIGYTHGSDEGKRINTIMSVEQPEAWGRTKFRYLHAGHYHSLIAHKEENGCIVSYLGSPSGTDAWHYSKGYLGAVKCGYGFVYDRDLGQRLEIRSNII